MAERDGRAKVRTWPTGEAARARALALGPPLWSSWLDLLRSWAHAEAGPGRLLPWVPVAFGAGIALYFAAEHEPIGWVAALAAAAFVVAALALRKQRVFPLAVLIAALAAGFATVALKASRVAHPVLAQPLYGVTLQGFVETREEREKTDRFVLRVAHDGNAAGRRATDAGAAIGEEGHGSRGRQFRRVEGAADAAAAAAATGRL